MIAYSYQLIASLKFFFLKKLFPFAFACSAGSSMSIFSGLGSSFLGGGGGGGVEVSSFISDSLPEGYDGLFPPCFFINYAAAF